MTVYECENMCNSELLKGCFLFKDTREMVFSWESSMTMFHFPGERSLWEMTLFLPFFPQVYTWLCLTRQRSDLWHCGGLFQAWGQSSEASSPLLEQRTAWNSLFFVPIEETQEPTGEDA